MYNMAINKSAVLTALLILIQYLGSNASETQKPCIKCVKSKSGNYHHLPQSFSNASRTSVYQRDIFEHPKRSNTIHHQEKRMHQITQYDTGSRFLHSPVRIARAAQKPDSLANLRRRPDNIRKLMLTNSERRGPQIHPGAECNFEKDCRWTWKTDIPNGFVIASSNNLLPNETGPSVDAENNANGHYLLLRLSPGMPEVHVISPRFDPSKEGYSVKLSIYQEGMDNGIIRIVLHNINRTQVVVGTIQGDNSKRWVTHEISVGKISQQFNIILEVMAAKSLTGRALVAFDKIKLLKCFPEGERVDLCTINEYRCSTTNLCVNISKVCDIEVDCANGDDENQNCDKIPYGARCTFEQDWCGWYNEAGKVMQWTIQHGSPGNNLTGPSEDHTFGNSTGKYLHVLATKEHIYAFASIATVRSVTFNPPPRVHGNSSSRYYNSCTVRFFLHQSDHHKSGFMLQVTELRPKENVSTKLVWSYNNFKETWRQQIVILPNITYRYYLHFDLRIGIRYVRDIAIDDLSLSPECFGLNIPQEELNGYNYYNPYFDYPWSAEPHKDFANRSYYELTTCGQTGRYGPSKEQCEVAYNNTNVKVKVLDDHGMYGIQKWTVPNEGYYTFFLFGASGGKGSGGMGSSRGAMVRIVLELRKNQDIYVAVGQEGANACVKSLGHQTNSSCESVSTIRGQNMTGIKGVLYMEVNDGGGGGGGASYIFSMNRNKVYIPLAVAAGGGGLGLGRFIDSGSQHGQAVNATRKPVTGEMYGSKSAGAGGGWLMFQGQVAVDHELVMGHALTKGGAGGKACYNSTDGKGDGGFGGGGGGCRVGGGGGGYSGGNAWSTSTMSLFSANTTNGEGGYSYFDLARGIGNISESVFGYHAGQGAVLIIPAISGCGCNYRCLALDPRRSKVTCICPKNWKLDLDEKQCLLLNPPEPYPTWFVFTLIGSVLCLTIAIGVV